MESAASSLTRITGTGVSGQLQASRAFEVARLPSQARLQGHCHESDHICVVVHGGFDEDGHCCGPGVLRLSPAGDRHDLQFGASDTTCLLLYPTPEEVRCWPGGRTFFRDERIWRLAQEAVSQAKGREPEPIWLESMVAEILAAVGRRETRGDRLPPVWLRRLRERLDEDVGAHFSLAQLARDAGVAREHAARAFRAHYGMAIGRYLRNRRLRHVHERLMGTNQSLADLAVEAGFADQSHLTRVFRGLWGSRRGPSVPACGLGVADSTSRTFKTPSGPSGILVSKEVSA